MTVGNWELVCSLLYFIKFNKLKSFKPKLVIPSLQDLIAYVLILLMVFSLFLYSKAYLESYTSSDWLVNYQGGFIRRGLIGQIVYIISWNKSSILMAVYAIQVILSLLTSWLILKIYFSTPKTYSWLMVLLSPAFFFVFAFYDISAALRKELIIFFSISLLAYSLMGNRVKVWYLRISLAIYFLAVFSHEIASLFLPFFIYLLYVQFKHMTGNKIILKKYMSYFSVVALGGLAASIFFHGNEAVISKICHSLYEKGFSTSICSAGSMSYMTKDLSYATSAVMLELNNHPYIPLFLVCLLLSLLPFFCNDWLREKNSRILLIVGFIFMLPLFSIGVDWGRWIHIYIVLLSICLLFDATKQTINFALISWPFLFLFIAFWALPMWFYKPSGVLQSYGPYLPQVGILDRVYFRLVSWAPNENLRALKNDLTPFLENYKNIEFYPLKKNSDAQNFISQLTLFSQNHTNSSFLNVLGTSKIFSFNSNDEIQNKNDANERVFSAGLLKLDTLYIFPLGDLSISRVLPIINPARDMILDAGLFGMVIPNWRSCTICFEAHSNHMTNYDLTQLDAKKNQWFNFAYSKEGKNPLLIKGWQPFSEDWGVWSDGKGASLILPIPAYKVELIEINLRAFIAGKDSTLPIQVRLNDDSAIPFNLTNFHNNRILLAIPKSSFVSHFIKVEFIIDSPKRPIDYGIGSDERLIGIGLKSIRYLP